jgi:hypothetical protein
LNGSKLLHFIWENEASAFIDQLVDLDIRYLAVQRAIELVIETGIILEYSIPIVIDDDVVYIHTVPAFFDSMIPFVVLYTDDGRGTINVLRLVMLS